MATEPPDTPDATPAAAPPQPARRRRWPRILAGAVLLPLLLLAGLVAAGAWALRSESGTRAVLGAVPGLQVEAARGTLLGDFAADRVVVALPRDGRVEIGALRWTGLGLRSPDGDGPLPAPLPRLVLHIDRLEADRVVVTPGAPAPPAPAGPPPERLVSPVGVELGALQVGELRLAGGEGELPPVRGLRFGLSIPDGAGTHELRELSLAWDRFLLSGAARLGAESPMPLQARMALREAPDAARDAAPSTLPQTPGTLAGWAADLRADGPLQRFEATLGLRAAAQSVDAQATVTPFGALPLAGLRASTDRLDLAPLLAGAPTTAITARIDAALDAGPRQQPLPLTEAGLQIDARLRNDAGGRWDAGRVPLRELTLRAERAAGAAPGELGRFDARLGADNAPGGRVHGAARWDGERWHLDATLEDVLPAALDGRAPPLRLGGPIQLSGRGQLPFGLPPTTPADAATLQARASIDGRWIGDTAGAAISPLPVSAQLAATLTPQRHVVEALRLGSAGGQVEFKGHAEPRADASGVLAAWMLVGDVALKGFDPRPWSRAAAQALGDRPTDLNGTARFDLRVPAEPPRGSGPTPWLTAVRGNAALDIDRSRLAGAPLALQLSLRDDAAARTWRAEASLEADGNRLQATGSLDAADPRGAGDRWTFDLDAPALSALTPLLQVVDPAASLEGEIRGEGRLAGRWPALTTGGQLAGARLRLPGLALAQAEARWQLGTSPDDPMTLDARLDELAAAGQSVESLRVSLDGSGRAHALTLAARARPPAAGGDGGAAGARTGDVRASPTGTTAAGGPADAAAAAAGAGPADERRLDLALQANGGWQGDLAAGAIGWRGRVGRLELTPSGFSGPPLTLGAPAGSSSTATGPGAPSTATAPASSPASPADPGTPASPTLAGSARDPGAAWLRAQPFDVDLSSGPDGAALSIGATTLDLFGAALRLGRLAYAAPAGAPADLQLDAELQPLAVAPLLAQLQPRFGWGGTLEIGGRVSLRSGGPDGFVADAVLERRRGDLSVTDPSLAAVSVPVSGASGVPGSGAAANPLDLGATQRLGLREARLSLSARNGTWRLGQRIAGRNLGEVTGEQTLQADPRAIWPGDEAPLRGSLDVVIENLGVWSGWLPAGWRLGGSVDWRSSVGGTLGAPAYTGQLTGQALSARNLLVGVDIRDGELAVALEGESARIERFVLSGREGRLEVGGDATFGATPTADLRISAERFAALARVDRRVLVSGDARIRLGANSLSAEGGFTADEGLIDISQGDAPSLPDDVAVVGESEPEAPAPEGGNGAAPQELKLQIDLRAGLGRNFRLRGRGIDTLLRGDVHLTSPNNRPQLRGVIRTEDGVFAAYAQKLTIERGTVTFNGPIDNPQLDILALRAKSPTAIDDEVTVGVQIIGSAQNPRIRLYSDPEMSDSEKLSWLVLGRGPNDLGRTELALVQQAALALLSGDDNTEGNPLLQRIGIDELSVRQDDESGVRETVVSLGKQLSRRWYVGYERSLNATTGTWQLIYRLARRLTVRAQSGLDNSLDLIWTWRWQ